MVVCLRPGAGAHSHDWLALPVERLIYVRRECVPSRLDKIKRNRVSIQSRAGTTVCSLLDIRRVLAGCERRCSALSFTMLLVAHSEGFVPHRKLNSQRQQKPVYYA
jgi:hypothetical protein